MAYAFHTNVDAAREPEKYRRLAGFFWNKETEVPFEWSNREPNDGLPVCRSCFPHVVYVGGVSGWPWRYAKVGKTVVTVAVDENEETGELITEKWKIKGRRDYP